MSSRPLGGCSYHAARGFLDHLGSELGAVDRADGDLLTILGPRRRPLWVRNIWIDPVVIDFSSVGDAAKKLRDIQRNWAPLPARLHRRTALIAAKLPPLPSRPKPFPFEIPEVPMGAFTLLDEGRLLAAPTCTSPFPNGEFEFEEDHEGPPSRAYRKLWEALLLAGRRPAPGERCLDAGAAPGGWTWALAGLGASVLAVDRAALDPRIAALPGVEARRGDAFALRPAEVGSVDWLLSDVISYPPVLLEWVEGWVASGLAKNMICTIKMQGESFDRATVARFAAIPGSRVVHLWHNRHELCWMRVEGDRGLGS